MLIIRKEMFCMKDVLWNNKIKVEQQLKDKLETSESQTQNAQDTKTQNEQMTNQNVGAYEAAIDLMYANNPDFAVLLKSFIQSKMETVAHITLLANLLVEKGVATPEEITNALCEENMNMLIKQLRQALDESAIPTA